jgi:hypothetical protein
MKDLLWNGRFEEQCLVLEIWLSNISLSLRVDITHRLSWRIFLEVLALASKCRQVHASVYSVSVELQSVNVIFNSSSPNILDSKHYFDPPLNQ